MLYTQPQGGPLQIDWDNQITRALSSAHILNANKRLDMVRRASTVAVGTKTINTALGMASGFGATMGVAGTDRVPTLVSGALTSRTIMVRAIRNGSGGGALGRLFDKTSGATGQFLYYSAGTIFLTYGFYLGGTEQICQISSTAAAVGTPFDLVVTHEVVGTAHTVLAYINGALVNSTTRTGALTDAASTVLTIGNRASDNARGWDGAIESFYTWDRIISAEEARALSDGPYQIVLDDEGDDDILFAPTATPGGSSGALAIQFGEISLSGAATVRTAAASATTFDVLASSGAITHPVSASSATTLSGLAVAATVSIVGTAASSTTMGAMQSAATAAVLAAPAASITLGAVQAASSATATVAGASSATLGALTLSSAVSSEANPARAASLSVTLGALALSSAAASPATRSAALSMGLGALGVTASGTSTLTAVVARQLQAMGLSSAANTPSTGRAAILLGGMVASAAGYIGENEPIIFARAPSGSGYAPAASNNTTRPQPVAQSRPAMSSSARPASIQRNTR